MPCVRIPGRAVEGCQQDDPSACEVMRYLDAEAEAERTGELTPYLRYSEDAFRRGVAGMCESADILRKAM